MKRTLTIIAATVAVMTASAQTVGLVLSGGGAKGLYHVGIIKALEENRIPIDYVSGASMGAVVGGMYAMGYSPEEMIRFFESDSVSQWLAGQIPPEYSYFFKREGTTPQMISVNIKGGEKASVKLPTSLLSSYLLDLAFMEMMTGASWAARENFDSLFVPFRCVSTDVYHKSLVTHKDGPLAFAVRSSMAIPMVFKPMKQDTILLYDGGMLNNFPWQCLEEEFKPDIMIGGVCVGNNKNPSEDDLIGQIMTIFTGQTDYSLPDNGKNLCIKRRFKDVGMLDYSKAKAIIEAGYKDAMEVMPEILEYMGRRSDSTDIASRRREFRRKIEPIVFDSVLIEGVTDKQKDFLYRQLGYNNDGSDYSIGFFKQKYLRILGAGVFDASFPRVTYNPQSRRYQLHLTMSAKPEMKFSFGGNLSSTSLNQMYAGFRYAHVNNVASTYDIGGLLGSFYNAVGIAGRHDFYTNFPFCLYYRYTWEQYDYTTNHMHRYSKDNDWELGSHVSNSVDLGFAASAFSSYAFKVNLTLGVNDYLYYPGLHITGETTDNTDFKYCDLDVQIRKNSLNFPLYPTLGMDFKVDLQYWTGIENYKMGNSIYSQTMGWQNVTGKNRNWLELDIKFEKYHDLGRLMSLGYLVDTKVSNAPDFANDLATYFMRTQFSPTIHSETMFMPEFRSASHLALGIVPIFKFTNNKKFFLKAYAYGYIPQETVYDDGWLPLTLENFSKNILGVFGGSLVYQTPVGPASISYNKYTTGPNNWGLMVNFGYSIFNLNKH